jgi:hypothetical protein
MHATNNKRASIAELLERKEEKKSHFERHSLSVTTVTLGSRLFLILLQINLTSSGTQPVLIPINHQNVTCVVGDNSKSGGIEVRRAAPRRWMGSKFVPLRF